MPKLHLMGLLSQRRKRFVSPDLLKAGPVLNFREGEMIIATYTSATRKMKFFSAYIREGLENGDAVIYGYPDEESGTIRAKLRENGIDVEKYEKDGTLLLRSVTEFYMPNGKLDFEKAFISATNQWTWAKKKGYRHTRNVEDLGDFSFINGQWQKWITDYWLDPRWDDPDVSEWVISKEPVGVVYDPFIMEIDAINVEHMTETQVTELLKAFGRGKLAPARFIDLLESMNSFSASIGLDHERLLGRNILLEYDPASDYEKVINDLAKECTANVEPIFVFTPNNSPLHKYLAEQPAIKFFLTSISTSNLTSASQNKVLLPAKSTSLILDALGRVLETYAHANVFFVFDILSELLTSREREETLIFLRYALDMLSTKKTTGLFLLNSGANEPQLVSQIRGLFHNMLTYEKTGLKIVKIS